MTVRVATLLVVVASAACIKIEKFKGGDAGNDGSDANGDAGGGSGAVALDDGSHIHAELPGVYRMDFSAEGFHFPDAFTIGSTQILGLPQTGCNIEEGVGVTYVPAAVFTSRATSALTAADPVITRPLPGPGVAKVAIDWSASFAKSMCVGNPSGRTTFTFFPDGRITRFDVARMDGTPDGDLCKCSGSSGFWEVGSYFTFDETTIQAVSGVVRPVNVGDNSTPTAPICMTGTSSGAYSLAMSWRAPRGSRVRRVTPTSLATITDLIPVASSTALPSTIDDSITTLWASVDQGCNQLTDRVAPYADDIQLKIEHGTNTEAIGLGQDGMYGGETAGTNKDGGRYIAGAPITLSTVNGNIPPFALWLNLQDFPTIVSVSAPHTRQEITPNEWVFWFPNGLSGTDTIVINVQ